MKMIDVCILNRGGAGRRDWRPLASASLLLMVALLFQLALSSHQKKGSSNLVFASASPIADLATGGGLPRRQQHLFGQHFFRDPMPWEDGYFDPTYHAWPGSKSRQAQASDKQSVKLVGSGSANLKTAGGTEAPPAQTQAQEQTLRPEAAEAAAN